MNDKAETMVSIAYKALDEKKGNDIRVISLEGVSTIADFFIIASGDNANQVQALTDNCMEKLYKEGFEVKNVEGPQTNWVLMDYGDVVIHVFSKEDRLFYDLERIWRDGRVLDAQEIQNMEHNS